MEYYRLILYIIFGIIPSIIWLLYYLKKDLHPEPKKMILKVFLFGMLVTVPVFFIEMGLASFLKQLQPFPLFTAYPWVNDVLKWFIVIALTEELLKYLVVKLAVFSSYELDEPLDIMLYMVVGALGFAALENILYLFSPIDGLSFQAVLQTTAMVSFIRFIGATFLHTLCSALLGYFLVLSFMHIKRKMLFTMTGIVLAVGMHGLYNFSIMQLQTPFNFLVPVAILISLALVIIFEFDRIKKLNHICEIEPSIIPKIKLKKLAPTPVISDSVL